MVKISNAMNQVMAASAAAASSSPRVVSSASSAPLKPPKTAVFEGQMGFEVDTWLRSIKKQFEWYGAAHFPNDAARIRYAALHFENSALDWWETADKASLTTWEEFVELLHDRYRPKLAAEVARQQMSRLKQKGTVTSLCNIFLRYAAQVPTMHEDDKIFLFKQALDQAIAAKVAESKPVSLQEAMHTAVQMEIYVGKRQSNGAPLFQPYNRAAASHSSSTGSTAMDVNFVGKSHESEDDSEIEEKYPSPHGADSSSDTMKLMMAKLESMDARLNSMGPKPSAKTKFGKATRVPGLKMEDISRLRSEGRCFRCKQTGHMKNECTNPPRLNW
jgi:hypothetical protein